MKTTLIPVLSALLLSVAACSKQTDPQVEVQGMVTWNGAPLSDGRLRFVPKTASPGPERMTRVLDGRFRVAGKFGLTPGRYRVEITAYRDAAAPGLDDGLPETPVPLQEQFIPARWNSDSELTIDVPQTSSAEFDFDLE